MTQNTPPMDWYPDPADATRERYWDGTQWTHNTRPARPVAPADPWSAQGPDGTAAPAPTGVPAGWPDAAAGQNAAVQQPGFGHNPYQNVAAPGVPATPDGVPLSGWWRRVFARIIDWFVTTFVAMILGWHWVHLAYAGFHRLMQYVMAEAQAGHTITRVTPDMLATYGIDSAVMTPISLIAIGVGLVYFAAMWALRGATLGQMVTAIRVVPAGEGRAPRRLPVVRALVRAVVLVVLEQLPSPWGLLCLLSYVLPLFTARRQAVHDLAARTQVVRTR